MNYPIGSDRCLMFILLLALILRGIRCAPEDGSAADGGQKALPTVAEAVDGTRSSLTEAGQQLLKGGSEAALATEQGLKAVGRVTMAVVGLLVSAWNAASQTAAATGLTVAKGYEKVNQAVVNVPVLGTISAGLQQTLSGTTAAMSQSVIVNSETRVKLVNDMRSKLDEFHPLKKDGEAAPAAAS